MYEYYEAGIDEYILSSNLGQPQSQHLDAMQRFAEEVMPNFRYVSQDSRNCEAQRIAYLELCGISMKVF